jgi:hypothetical protein
MKRGLRLILAVARLLAIPISSLSFAAGQHWDFDRYAEQIPDRRAMGKNCTASAPHYTLEGAFTGRIISGTWKFVVSPLVGQDARFAGSNCKGGKFTAEISADGRSIRFTNVEDPCNHSWNGMVLRGQ